MDPRRKQWNDRQRELRAAVEKGRDLSRLVDLFLQQHAQLHAGRISSAGSPTFEDEIWQGLGEAFARTVPPGFEHSIAWLVWHMARCEDITMNLLAAGTDQVLRQCWLERLGIPEVDTGNAMDSLQIAALSKAIDLDALRGYRAAVGSSTRQVVRQLSLEQIRQPVDPARLERIGLEGAVDRAAGGFINYWGRGTIGDLLLMPPTRHNFIHSNEALRIKQKVSVKGMSLS
jgi:hypothetical protein